MEIQTLKRTPSTLLIPKRDIETLNQKLQQMKIGLKEYFTFLVKKYRFATWIIREFSSSKIKKEYQSKGLDLQRRNFVPENDTWQELSQLASALGLSKTHTFMILFYLDTGIIKIAKEISKSAGVPIKKRKKAVLILQERLNLSQKTYTRILRLLV